MKKTTITTEVIIDDSDIKEMKRILINEFKFEWKQLIYWKTTEKPEDQEHKIGVQFIQYNKLETIITLIWKMFNINWNPLFDGLQRYMYGDLLK